MTSASDFTQSGMRSFWMKLLRDEAALLRHPGGHHKKLLDEAHALHKARLIDREGLAGLLEQADGALAYAVEALLDEINDQ